MIGIRRRGRAVSAAPRVWGFWQIFVSLGLSQASELSAVGVSLR